jgi:hypothetical protein
LKFKLYKFPSKFRRVDVFHLDLLQFDHTRFTPANSLLLIDTLQQIWLKFKIHCFAALNLRFSWFILATIVNISRNISILLPKTQDTVVTKYGGKFKGAKNFKKSRNHFEILVIPC